MMMHIDMDAFFASVEQAVNPRLRGKPVIIGGRPHKYRSIVVAASYEAKALGIGAGMGSWAALRICPQACFVPADTAKYVSTSDGIYKILRNFCPQVDRYSIDEFFIDLQGCDRIFTSPEDFGRLIKNEIKEIFGLTCSVGIAATKMIAKLAAKTGKPDGLLLFDRKKTQAVLENLPVDKLCGVGKRIKKRLNSLGIETCGQLSRYPDRVLRQQFGVMGVWLKKACLMEEVGNIPFLTKAPESPKSVGHSQTLREPSYSQELISAWIYLLAEMVCFRLRKKKLQGRTVCLYIADGFESGWAKRHTFSEASYDGQEVYRRCLFLLRLICPEFLCVRVISVNVSGLRPADDLHLFEKQRKRERLMRSVDDINQRFGEWTVFPALVGRGRQEG